MLIPQKNTLIDAIDKAHETKENPRPHLGPSQMGNPCDRAIWLQFRWATQENFPGRIKRLFRRGQNEEAIVVSDLRLAGVDVRETGKNQRRVHFGGHIYGSIDGIIHSGVPEAPKKQHILEIKTHSKKSFEDLAKHGVEKSKPEHYTQMQMYMAATGIDRGLYAAVCKDDDRYYFERVRYIAAFAKKAIERAHRITMSESIPAPISQDPSWYQCKFCASHDFCFGSKKTKAVNCRTCAHSTPKEDGTWACAKWGAEILQDAQYLGCDYHTVHPDMVPWRLVQDVSEEFAAAYEINGKIVMNGYGYTSSYLLLNVEQAAGEETEVEMVLRVMGGEVCK